MPLLRDAKYEYLGLVALLAACGTAASTTPGRDAAVIDAPAADAPPPKDAPSPGDLPILGPLDGPAWRVTDIRCDGASASVTARAFITAPNSSSFVVRGDRSEYTLRTPTCAVTLTSSVTYPAPGRAVFTATGPFACAPAMCALECGTTPRIPYVYDYVRAGASLTMTSVGDTPDLACTGNGQSNPISYTYSAM